MNIPNEYPQHEILPPSHPIGSTRRASHAKPRNAFQSRQRSASRRERDSQAGTAPAYHVQRSVDSWFDREAHMGRIFLAREDFPGTPCVPPLTTWLPGRIFQAREENPGTAPASVIGEEFSGTPCVPPLIADVPGRNFLARCEKSQI